MKKYLRFKKWVEQKKIQRKLDKFMVLWVVLIVIISIGLFNTDFSSVLGLSTKKEAPLIIFPTPTIVVPTDYPTPTVIYIQPTLAPQIQQQAPSKIDCVGPDSKHFQTTQKECDDFNSAWKKQPNGNIVNCKLVSGYTIPTTLEDCNRYNAGNKTQSSTQVSIPFYCKTVYGEYLTTSVEECNKATTESFNSKMKYSDCMAGKNATLNSCNSTCGTEYQNGKDACSWAYTGTNPGIVQDTNKYFQCTGEALNVWSSCTTKCDSDWRNSIGSCVFQ